MRLKKNSKANDFLLFSQMVIKKFPFKLKKNSIIELGMGKGEMITTMANQNPHHHYLGIEKYATVAAKALKKAQTLNLNNFFIIVKDISQLDHLVIGKTQTIWLTFPDPWPKFRHQKRRLTHTSFLNLYKKILTKDGVIKFKTDHDDFFNYSCDSFIKNGWKLKNVTNNFHNESFANDNIKTGYETKWSLKGKKINYLEATK